LKEEIDKAKFNQSKILICLCHCFIFIIVGLLLCGYKMHQLLSKKPRKRQKTRNWAPGEKVLKRIQQVMVVQCGIQTEELRIGTEAASKFR